MQIYSSIHPLQLLIPTLLSIHPLPEAALCLVQSFLVVLEFFALSASKSFSFLQLKSCLCENLTGPSRSFQPPTSYSEQMVYLLSIADKIWGKMRFKPEKGSGLSGFCPLDFVSSCHITHFLSVIYFFNLLFLRFLPTIPPCPALSFKCEDSYP